MVNNQLNKEFHTFFGRLEDFINSVFLKMTFASFSETILSLGIPFIIIKFFPSFIEENQAKASRIATIFLKYALIVGIGYAVLIYFLRSPRGEQAKTE